jgi:hypothetical protein
MGFLASASTVVLTAKLTPYGRQQLLTNSSSIITQFSVGDSDANYYGDLPLINGRVPDMTGELGANNTFNNGVYTNTLIRYPIQVNTSGAFKKAVQSGSNAVVITPVVNGAKTINDGVFTTVTIDRTLGDTDGNSNLFQSFGLPITQTQKNQYTSGTYLSTAIETLNQDKALVFAISPCEYGEVIDGKTVKIVLSAITAATDYTIYSTFQKSLTPLTTQDAKVVENQSMGVPFGKNIALLFSDQVKKPNGTATKSWATGYGTTKPFSLNAKEQFNSVTNTSTSTVVDTAVGIVYLDKGIVVITHQDIVNDYDPTTGGTTSISFNHISNEVAQDITCIVERNEFATSSNPTHTSGELIRVSEIALYDATSNVIALAKSNEHILIGANQFMALGVRILV